jgi:PAS domain-containing protein
MWFTIQGLARALQGEEDSGLRLLLLSMIEQGLCDRSMADVPCDPARFTSIVESLRGLVLDHAAMVTRGAAMPARDAWRTLVRDAADLRFRGSRPAELPTGFGRRKYWVSMPEALALHHDGLETVVASARRAVNGARTAPSLVLGIRTSGSLLAPLIASLCHHGGEKPAYATIRPLLDLREPRRAGAASPVALDAHARRLIEACRGEVWLVDDPSDSGETREAAAGFVTRMAPQCAVSFLPVGRRNQALREYGRQMRLCTPAGPVRRLAAREVHEPLRRKVWHHREGERVYKAYGDHRLARIECQALRALSPDLSYDAAGSFMSSRFLGAPRRSAPSRSQVAALGESMARYRDLFRVEPVPVEVWDAIVRRRARASGGAGEDLCAADAVGNLVRSNGQLAWWHYRLLPGAGGIERVSADLGHWSTVVDMGELLASALLELALDADASRLLVDVYTSASGDPNVRARLRGCLRLYLQSLSERIQRATGPPRARHAEERRATLGRGLAWLQDAGP